MQREDSRSTGNRDLYRAGGVGLVGAAIALIAQLPLLYLSESALYANATATGIKAVSSNFASYSGFISAIVALDVFGIIAFGAFYFVFRRVNLLGALGALLFGVVALTVDLAVDLPVRFVQISAANEFAAATSATQQTAILALFHFTLDFSNDTLLMSTFLLGLAFALLSIAMLKERTILGNRTSFLCVIAAILTLAEVPLALPASNIPFLIAYLGATVVQIIFFLLAGFRLYRM
jgi:hypothetical protein